MDGVRQWAFSLCATMVACGVARMLLPKGSLQKVVSITISVFFLCAMISPLMGGIPSFAFDISGYEQVTPDIERRAKALSDTVAGQTEEAARISLAKIIGDKLSEMGIKYSRVTININTNGQNPQAESADITLDRVYENDHDGIRAALEQEFGMKIRLGYVSMDAEGSEV